MFGKIKSWFSGLSKAGKIGVVLASLVVVGAAASPNSSHTPPATQSPVVQPTTKDTKAAVIEKKTVTETQNIPFEKTSVQDSSLEQGKTVLKTAGVNGVKTLTYELTLRDGVQTDKKLIKEEITLQPVSEITAIGTKIPQPVLNCPNGTYINSAGNEVCSPYSSPSAPAGATAQCRDGTYSFSQSRSGTCSHHGGVATWL